MQRSCADNVTYQRSYELYDKIVFATNSVEMFAAGVGCCVWVCIIYISFAFAACPTVATISSQAERSPLPVEVSSALAALRCLPCLVASFAVTEDARREAVILALKIVDKLMTALYSPKTATNGEPPEAMLKGAAESGGRGSAEKRQRKRKKVGSRPSDDGGDAGKRHVAGEQHENYGGRVRNEEAVVMRAYALEANVGLCCLLPSAEEGHESSRKKTLARLLGWHDR